MIVKITPFFTNYRLIDIRSSFAPHFAVEFTRMPSSLSFSTYASKVVILCRNDIENRKSENTHSNARWKYRDWIATFCYQKHMTKFCSFTIGLEKTRIWWSLPVEIIKIMKKQHEKLGANIFEQLMWFTTAVKSADNR